MSEKVNFNTNTEKGEADVRFGDDFDAREAEVKRSGDAEWDDFEVMGENNREEGEYRSSVEIEPMKMREAIERFRQKRFGLDVLKAARNAM